MLFADATQRFWQLRAANNGSTETRAELQALARLIDALLEARVQRKELPQPEARALKQHVQQVLQQEAGPTPAR